MKFLKLRLITLSLLTAGLLVVAGSVWLRFQLRDLGHLTVRFFDVGQGDAILVTTPSGGQILVDGGPDNALLHKIGRALPVWDREIELLVVTHPHADHLVGLVELLRRYRVRQVLVSGMTSNTPEYQVLRAEFQRQGITEISARGPLVQELEPGLSLRVVHPNTATAFTENPNDASVVLQLVYGETEVLLTGDLEAEGQRVLPQAWLGSDVLKVAHHGSADALVPDVLAAIASKLAVISVGKNTYGHPSPRVSKALERLGAIVLTTQTVGDVTVVSDGTAAWFFSSRGGPRQRLTVQRP